MNDLNIAERWINQTKARIDKRPYHTPSDDAALELLDLVSNNQEEAVNVIVEIIKKNPSASILNRLGAGPVENLLSENPEYIKIISIKVQNKFALKECLRFVNSDEGSVLEKELLEALKNL